VESLTSSCHKLTKEIIHHVRTAFLKQYLQKQEDNQTQQEPDRELIGKIAAKAVKKG
jgi:hypothetical protein